MKPDRRRATITIALLATGGLGLFAGALGIISCTEPKRPDGGVGLLPVGAPAPDMEGSDVAGRPVRLASARGHASVVFFYPKDDTPGCTKEACAFRDAFDKFGAAGISIFGVSRDSAESHRAFREKHKLPFAMVADESGAVQRAYGVSSFLGMPTRVTFLVGPDGNVARVYPDVDPAVHADEVLAAAKGLDVPAATLDAGAAADAERE